MVCKNFKQPFLCDDLKYVGEKRKKNRKKDSQLVLIAVMFFFININIYTVYKLKNQRYLGFYSKLLVKLVLATVLVYYIHLEAIYCRYFTMAVWF